MPTKTGRTKAQTIIYKTLHRKGNTEQQDPHYERKDKRTNSDLQNTS